LDNRGYAFLKAAGQESRGRFHAQEQADREWLFLRHTLSCNDLLISAHLLAKTEPGIELVRFRTERDLKRSVLYVPDGKSKIGIASDGWIDLAHGQLQTCLAFELDRGTVEREPWRRRIRGMVKVASGPYQSAFETDSLTIAVVTTSGDKRLRSLISWTEQELADIDAKSDADLFRFAALDPRSIGPAELFFTPRFLRPFDPYPLPLLSRELP